MTDMGVIGGLGGAEIFFMLFVWVLPLWIVWKFYGMLSRINNNLAVIAQALRERPRP